MVFIVGDSAGAAILQGAATIWNAKTGQIYYSKGFTGSQDNSANRQSGWVYCYADNQVGTHANAKVIGKDAMVFIVGKNNKIPWATIKTDLALATSNPFGSVYYGVHVVSTTVLTSLYTLVGTSGATALYEGGACANKFQCYTFNSLSGSRVFFNSALGITMNAMGPAAVEVLDDYDMVDSVAKDPLGIGYCSSSFADINRVEILAVATWDDSERFVYPRKTAKTNLRWVMPAMFPIDSTATWPPILIRSLYIDYQGGVSGNYSNSPEKFLATMFGTAGAGKAAMDAGPLYKASFFTSAQ